MLINTYNILLPLKVSDLIITGQFGGHRTSKLWLTMKLEQACKSFGLQMFETLE
jgi:hypothetical protein